MTESGVALKEGEPADSHELMDAGVAANEHVVFYGDVSANQRAVGQNNVVADLGVMPDVAAGHKQVVAADDCRFLLGVGAVNGGMFPKSVARTDNRLTGSAGVADILGGIANDASGMEDAVLSQFGLSREGNVGANPATVANFDFPVNHGARADEDVFANLNFGANDGCGMMHKRRRQTESISPVRASRFSQGAVGFFLASVADDDVVEDSILSDCPACARISSWEGDRSPLG